MVCGISSTAPSSSVTTSIHIHVQPKYDQSHEYVLVSVGGRSGMSDVNDNYPRSNVCTYSNGFVYLVVIVYKKLLNNPFYAPC